MTLRIVTLLFAMLLGAVSVYNHLLDTASQRLYSLVSKRGQMCAGAADRGSCLRGMAVAFAKPEYCNAQSECVAEIAATKASPAPCLAAKNVKECFDNYVRREERSAHCDDVEGDNVAAAQCQDSLRQLVKEQLGREASVCTDSTGEARILCLKQLAVESLEPQLCSKLPNDERNACFLSLIDDLSPDESLALCQKLEPEQVSRDCVLQVARRAPQLCRSLGVDALHCLKQSPLLSIDNCVHLDAQSHEECIELVAFRDKRPDYCSRLKDEKRRAGCQATAYRSVESCEGLPQFVRSICKDSVSAAR